MIMNNYKKSMEDVRLTEEARAKIKENVYQNFLNEGKASGVKSVKNIGVMRSLAAAAVILLILVPVGFKLISDNNKKLSIDASPTALKNETLNYSVTDTPESESYGKSATKAAEISKGGDEITETNDSADALAESKITVGEATACSYELNGLTADEFVSKYYYAQNDDLIDILSEENANTAREATSEAGTVKYLEQDGLVVLAYWTKGDSVVICDFSVPVDIEKAKEMVQNLYGLFE